MEVLFGLVIATLAVIGWAYGSLFACIFLTLPTIPVAFMLTEGFSRAPVVVVLWAVLLAAIWAPRLYRRSVAQQAIGRDLGMEHLHSPLRLTLRGPG